MKGECKFFSANHLLSLREERRGGHKNRYDKNNVKLKGLVWYLISTDRRLIPRARNTGACMNFQGTTVTSAVFLAM